VDDGLRAGLININQLRDVTMFKQLYSDVTDEHPQLPRKRVIYEIVRRMIHNQITDLIAASQQAIVEANPSDIDDVRRYPEALMRFSNDMQSMHQELKQFLMENLYRHYRVHRMSGKARRIIHDLFQAFMDDIRLLPPEHRHKARQREQENGEAGRGRAVADYIAGMTDRYAITEHQRLFDPLHLT
jgi:dGTPase